jgi:hypothetical protein
LALEAAGRGPFGTGGTIALYAAAEILLAGALQAPGSGENGLGGRIVLDSFEEVAVSSGVTVSTAGDAAAPRSGEGGRIEAAGCRLELAAGSELLATGELGGTISLTSSEAMVLAAAISAENGGLIDIRFPPGLPPRLDGPLAPEPYLAATAIQGPCLFPPPCEAVAGLLCAGDGSEVALSWQSAPGHSMVEVLRDGAVLATLEGSLEGYRDAGLPPGTYTYTVKGLCLEGDAAEATCSVKLGSPAPSFIRSECSGSGGLDISDAAFLLALLFQGGAPPECEKACDSNDDGELDISDAIHILIFLFLFLFLPGGKAPPPPHPDCGSDPTADSLPCPASRACP